MATLNQSVISTTSKEKMRELAKFIAAYNEFRGRPSAEVKRLVKEKYDGVLSDDKYNQLLLQSSRLTNERMVPTIEEWDLAKATFVEIGNEKIADAKIKLRDAIRKRNKIILDENGRSIPMGSLPKKMEDAQASVKSANLTRILMSAGLGILAAAAVIALAPTSVITLPVLLGALGGATLGGVAGAWLGKIFVNNASVKRDKLESLLEAHRSELEEIEQEIQQAEELVNDLEEQYDATIISESERADIEEAAAEAAAKAAEIERAEREEAARRAREEAAEEEEEEETPEVVADEEETSDEETVEDAEETSGEEDAEETSGEESAEEEETPVVVTVDTSELDKVKKELHPDAEDIERKAKEAAAIEKAKELCYNGVIIGATTKIAEAGTEKKNAEEKLAKLAELEAKVSGVETVEEAEKLLGEIKTTVAEIKVVGYRTESEKSASKIEIPTDVKDREKLRDRTTEKYLTERRKTHVEKKDGLINLNRVEEVESNPDLNITPETYAHAASELEKLMDTHATLSTIKAKGGFKARKAGEHDIEKVIAANATRLASNVAKFETETEIEDEARIDMLLREDEEGLTPAQKELLKKHKAKLLESEEDAESSK